MSEMKYLWRHLVNRMQICTDCRHLAEFHSHRHLETQPEWGLWVAEDRRNANSFNFDDLTQKICTYIKTSDVVNQFSAKKWSDVPLRT